MDRSDSILKPPVRVFYSYSHKDERLCEKLMIHLHNLKRQGVIEDWYDRMIQAGTEWESEISDKLNSADIVILLVSADFIASDYCWGIEMSQALEMHNDKKASLVPIILRPCDWSDAPFGKVQCLPKDAKPVTSWSNRDRVFTDIAYAIRKIAIPLQEKIYAQNQKAYIKQLNNMSTLEREIEEFINKHPQDPDVYLLTSIEEGSWAESDVSTVALRLKKLMQESGKWLTKYDGKNSIRKKKLDRTLRVISYIEKDK